MEISWKWGDQFFTWGVFLEGNGTELVDSWSLELEWHNEVPHKHSGRRPSSILFFITIV